jgi:putative isomerase
LETFAKLKAAVTTLGKAEWRPMLAYVAGLHARSTHPPQPPFPHAWEEIGPGYCYGPAFGHWDLIHAVLDVLPDAPAHARDQLLNGLAVQAPNGILPGVVYMPRADDPTRQEPRWSHRITHPPVWPLAVEDLLQTVDDAALLSQAFAALVRQIGWFEANRAAEPEGFYYTDILTSDWESGVDEGVRFDGVRPGPLPCVDATSTYTWLIGLPKCGQSA